jgi:hypothetical protein
MAKIIGYDATGYEVLTRAVSELLNQYPGLDQRIITFEELDATSGICFSADNGALIVSETKYVTDRVKQTCQYPFFVVYRTAATRAPQKIKVQTFLDTLGKWLCGEVAVIGDDEYRLTTLPDLAGDRKITNITRNNSYGVEPTDKGVQDWLLPVTIEYTYEYDRKDKPWAN